MDLINSRGRPTFFTPLIVVFIFIVIINRVLGPRKVLKMHFKGPVEKVWYDLKGYPFVIVKGHEYDLYGVIWHFNIKIKKGDIIIKKKGDLRIEVIKTGARDTLRFNSLDD